MDYLNSIITLITGLLAWLIYLYKKRAEKKEIVTILLNEIRTAEKEISKLQKSNLVTDYTFILPSNHWNNSQHLFTNNFDSDEMDKISEFFIACNLAEKSLKSIKSNVDIAITQKSRTIQDKLLELISNSDNEASYKIEKEKIIKKYEAESYFFEPSDPKNKLVNHLANIDQLLTSSIGIKLKNIRDAKWYNITI